MNPDNQQQNQPYNQPSNQQPPQLSPPTSPVQPDNEDQRLQNTNFPLKVMQEGERVVAHIKPHPIGLVMPALTAGLVLVFLIGSAAYASQLAPNLTSQTRTGLYLIAGLLSLLDIVFFYIANLIYAGNQWIITSDSITQLSQTGLFFKRTSQMSFENLEDVTFSQKGLLPSLLDFGALSAESAGNHSKFVFRYCPQPQKYATAIIAAHEEFMRHQENPTALISHQEVTS